MDAERIVHAVGHLAHGRGHGIGDLVADLVHDRGHHILNGSGHGFRHVGEHAAHGCLQLFLQFFRIHTGFNAGHEDFLSFFTLQVFLERFHDLFRIGFFLMGIRIALIALSDVRGNLLHLFRCDLHIRGNLRKGGNSLVNAGLALLTLQIQRQIVLEVLRIQPVGNHKFRIAGHDIRYDLLYLFRRDIHDPALLKQLGHVSGQQGGAFRGGQVFLHGLPEFRGIGFRIIAPVFFISGHDILEHLHEIPGVHIDIDVA